MDGSEQTKNVAPQGKSVGGPLRWSDNAKVKLRERFTSEKVVGGVCFFGCAPPTSWIDSTFVCYEETRGPYDAFLVDFGVSGSLPDTALGVHAKSKHGIRGNAFGLHGLATVQRQHATRVNNRTGSDGEGLSLTEYYVQVSGNSPQNIQTDRVEPPGTFQYVVEVGASGTSFPIPQNFKWLWIAPVHHSCYQSNFLGNAIPSTGMHIEEAERLAQVSGKPGSLPVPFSGEGYDEIEKFQAILLERNSERTVLSQAVLLQAQEAGGHINLRLNVPKSSDPKVVKPAKIIVGVQL